MPGRWITNCPVDLGELFLCSNLDLLSPRAVRSFCSVLVKAIIKNRIGTRPCCILFLTPTLNSIDVFTLKIMSLTMLLSYMRLIAERSLEGTPYFPSMASSSAGLELSKALTRSTNATHIEKLCLCLRCRCALIVNVPSWHPNPGVDTNYNFRPCILIILNSFPHMMLL